MGFLLSKLGWQSDSNSSDKDKSAPDQPEKKVYSWDLRSKEDEEKLKFSDKEEETLFKVPGDINGKPFNLVNLKSCRVYLLDNLATINVDKCSNCGIFIGPTNQSVFIRDSNECNFIVSCQQFRMRGCSKVNVLLHCTSQPIIESSTRIKFGCFQFYYEALPSQLKSANLSPFLNYWSNIYDFSPNSDTSNPNHGYLTEAKVSECVGLFDLSQIEPATLQGGVDVAPLKIDVHKSAIPKTNKQLDKSAAKSEKVTLLVVLPFAERRDLLQQLMEKVIKPEEDSSTVQLSQSVESTAMTQEELDRLLNIPALALNANNDSAGDSKQSQVNFGNKINDKGKVIGLLFDGEDSESVIMSAVAENDVLKRNSLVSRGQIASAQFEQLQNYMQMQFH